MSVNGKRFLEGSVRIPRCGRSLANWVVRHPRSAVKFVAMAGWIAIGLHGPIRQHGIGPCAPSSASWLAVRSCAGQYRPSCSGNGLRSKLPVGSSAPTREKPHNQVSHETIYRSLFIQARGVLKKELLEHLRAKRTIRRSKHASLKRNGLGQIKDAVSIRERPASVEDRAVPGHWEGDLIGGSRNSYVATLVERHSRYVMLVKVANKDTESVVSALIKQSQRLPRRTLPVADLGPRQRARRSPAPDTGHRRRGLFL